jgi:hypothetical protein
MNPTLNSIPWFKRFVSEILSDLRYQALNDLERGQLSHLELIYWRQGWIPSDSAQLSCPPYCTGVVSPKVVAMFSKAKGGKKLIHKGLQKQRSEYSEKCRRNAEHGRLGGRPKKTWEVSENHSVSGQKADGLSSESQEKEKRRDKEETVLAHGFI